MFFESDIAHRTQQTKDCITPSFTAFSDVANIAQKDLLNEPVAQQQPVTGLDQPVDFFASMPLATPSTDRMLTAAPSMDNAGWATFDTPPEEKQPGVIGLSGISVMDKHALSGDLFSFEPNNDQPTWLQSSKTSKNNASVTDQSDVPCKYTSSDASNSQVRNICIALEKTFFICSHVRTYMQQNAVHSSKKWSLCFCMYHLQMHENYFFIFFKKKSDCATLL